jgi:response regulator NasT
MERALIVCEPSASLAFVKTLKSAGVVFSETSFSAGEARRKCQYAEYDLIIINAPLQDDTGRELAADLSENWGSSIIMLLPGDVFEDVQQQMDAFGVVCLSKPLNRQLLLQALRIVLSVRKNIDRLKKENQKLNRRLLDLRTVNRAKIHLILSRKMTEDEAHRHIQKLAMERRVSPGSIAGEILALSSESSV